MIGSIIYVVLMCAIGIGGAISGTPWGGAIASIVIGIWGVTILAIAHTALKAAPSATSQVPQGTDDGAVTAAAAAGHCHVDAGGHVVGCDGGHF